ncbi:MAG: hypothetical protein U0232_13075 [Thermomicrobiales bacterium]
MSSSAAIERDGRALVAAHHRRCAVGQEPEIVVAVCGVGPHRFPRRGVQVLLRVLAQQFVEVEAAFGVVAHQGLVDQRRQQRQRCPGDSLGGLAAEAAAKDDQAAEDVPLVVAEQRPGVVEDRAHVAVPRGDVAQVGRQEGDVALDLVGDGRARQRPHPRRRQLDRQRQAFGETADAGDLGVLASEREVGAHAPGALVEEVQRVACFLGIAHPGRVGLLGRHRQPGQRVAPLLAEVEHFAGGGDQAEAGCRSEQIRQPGRFIEQVLEVIEDEQEVQRGEEARNVVARFLLAGQGTADRRRERGRDRLACRERLQEGIGDAIGKERARGLGTSSARRVLPIPPGPMMVTRRQPGAARSSASSASSIARPTKPVWRGATLAVARTAIPRAAAGSRPPDAPTRPRPNQPAVPSPSIRRRQFTANHTRSGAAN